jgi:hypothetical protein
LPGPFAISLIVGANRLARHARRWALATKADLIDYGSLNDRGHCFGQDHIAFALIRLVQLTEEQLSPGRFGGGFDGLSGAR